jgi:hypothetical protein
VHLLPASYDGGGVVTEAHYFAFRPHMGSSPRPCGGCGLPYGEGNHIEITNLKPYTRYVCPKDGDGQGHKGVWTGAHIPELRRIDEHLCTCGAEMVEEDTERWEISFELLTSDGQHWRPVSAVRSRHAAAQQHQGLLTLIEQGEQIRNVRLVQLGEVAS